MNGLRNHGVREVRIDEASAVEILQSWLDARAARRHHGVDGVERQRPVLLRAQGRSRQETGGHCRGHAATAPLDARGRVTLENREHGTSRRVELRPDSRSVHSDRARSLPDEGQPRGGGGSGCSARPLGIDSTRGRGRSVASNGVRASTRRETGPLVRQCTNAAQADW